MSKKSSPIKATLLTPAVWAMFAPALDPLPVVEPVVQASSTYPIKMYSHIFCRTKELVAFCRSGDAPLVYCGMAGSDALRWYGFVGIDSESGLGIIPVSHGLPGKNGEPFPTIEAVHGIAIAAPLPPNFHDPDCGGPTTPTRLSAHKSEHFFHNGTGVVDGSTRSGVLLRALRGGKHDDKKR